VEASLKEKNLNEMIELIHKEVKDNRKKIGIDELKKILFTKPLIKQEPSEEKLIEETEIETETGAEVLPDIEPAYRTGRVNEEKISVFPKHDPDEKEKEEIKEENEIKEKNDIREEKESFDELLESEINETVNKNSNPEEEGTLIMDEVEENQVPILEEEIIEDEEIETEIDNEELIEEHIPLGKESKKEKDVFSFMSRKEIDKIVSVIFNDDEDDFANTMEKISECRDYGQASEILKSVFFSYRVNHYKREAVTLTNAVSNYFHQAN
jgi:hypothetical protein